MVQARLRDMHQARRDVRVYGKSGRGVLRPGLDPARHLIQKETHLPQGAGSRGLYIDGPPALASGRFFPVQSVS